MRKLVLLVMLCTLGLTTGARAQGFDGGFVADYHQLPYRSMTSYGLHAYIQYDYITINYQLSIGTSSTGGFHVHAPAGAAAGAWLLSRIDSASFGRRILGVAGLLSLAIPEGVGVYLSRGDKLASHLIVNPLGYEYWKRKDPTVEEWRLSGTMMFRLRATVFPYKWMFVAPQVGVTYMYKDGQVGFKAGLTFGYHKEEE